LREEIKVKTIKEITYICSCEARYDNEYDAMDCEEGHVLDKCDHEKNAVYNIQGDFDYAEIVLVCKKCCSAPFYVLKTWKLTDLIRSGNYDEEKLKTIADLIGEGQTIEH
jgi:hypothetical protein